MIEALVFQAIDHIRGLTYIDVLGWIGSLCLACCAVPQAILSRKQGHSNGISNGLLWLWSLGEFFTLWYLLLQPHDKWNWPLIVNYTANIVFIGIVIWYKVFPRETLAYSIKWSSKD